MSPLAEDAVEIVPVSTPLELAQAALILGEQRAWTERLLGSELRDVQPSSRREYAYLADFYRRPDGQLLLARMDGEPVGVVGLRRLDADRVEGRRFYVRPSTRGVGVGRRLGQELIALARRLGFRWLYIETAPKQMAQAYELYRRIGFRETAKRGFADHDGVIAMELDLDAAAA